MTRIARVLFDECISKPAVEAMIKPLKFGDTDFEVGHVLDVFGSGAKDTDWIPKAAADKWAVVTADRGKKSRISEKLPLLCEAYGVPHVLMAPGFSKLNMKFRILKVMELWDEIVAASLGPAGARYSLRLNSSGSVRLVQTKVPTSDDIVRTQQLIGFPEDD